PLCFANPSPPSGWIGDFHPQAIEHAGHTTMATRWSDEDIAASLNRMGMPTGQGKTWTAHRVSSVRRVNGIHAYRSAEKNGEWFTMSEAATALGVTHHRIPGEFYVVGGEGFPVMPFDRLPQLKGEPAVVLIPRPALGQLGLNEFRSVLLFVLIEQSKIVEHAHDRRHGRDRRLLVDRHARRAVAVKELEDPAPLLRDGGTGHRREGEAARQRQRRYS